MSESEIGVSLSEMINNAILVVAHPDDEVLWFSAVLRKVNKVLICFLDYEPIPHVGTARRKIISEYPIDNVNSLGLVEAGTFDSVDWNKPKEASFGLETFFGDRASSTYQENFSALCEKLRPVVADFENVITHNPWGEYGHPDHVQVYRVIRALKDEFGFGLWFSNYCGDRSARLALKYISSLEGEEFTLPTDIEIATKLKRIYQEHECWSWFDDYEWFQTESYILDECPDTDRKSYGQIPLNMIWTGFPHAPKKNWKRWVRGAYSFVSRRFKQLLLRIRG